MAFVALKSLLNIFFLKAIATVPGNSQLIMRQEGPQKHTFQVAAVDYRSSESLEVDGPMPRVLSISLNFGCST